MTTMNATNALTARRVFSTLALAASAGLGATHAAPAAAAATPATTAASATATATAPSREGVVAQGEQAAHGTPAKPPAQHAARGAPHHAAQALHAMSMRDVHDRVVHARSAEQRRWIASELRHGKLEPATATELRAWVTHVGERQAALSHRGGETTNEALAISHEQDLLDWAIRIGNAAYAPQHALSGSLSGSLSRS